MQDDYIELEHPDGSKIRVSPLDLINPNKPKVDSAKRQERMDICKACPQFQMKFCKMCNCLMPIKTWLFEAECDLKKW